MLEDPYLKMAQPLTYLYFLPKLHKLEDLMLANWSAWDMSDEAWTPSQLPSVKMLLLSVEIRETDLLRLLRALPKLSDFRLCDINVVTQYSYIVLHFILAMVRTRRRRNLHSSGNRIECYN